MLTIWVHVVTGHLRRGEALLEGIGAVTVLHGNHLLLGWSQWCVGVHHSLHPIGHHLWRGKKKKTLISPCDILTVEMTDIISANWRP